MIEIDQSVNFFANIKALWTKNVGLFSWAIMDDKGGLVASECVKLCSRVWGHGLKHVEQLNRAGSSC